MPTDTPRTLSEDKAKALGGGVQLTDGDHQGAEDSDEEGTTTKKKDRRLPAFEGRVAYLRTANSSDLTRSTSISFTVKKEGGDEEGLELGVDDAILSTKVAGLKAAKDKTGTYIGNDFLELGIRDGTKIGKFGASGKPAGFKGRAKGSGIGMVRLPQKIDHFMPGCPYEEFVAGYKTARGGGKVEGFNFGSSLSKPTYKGNEVSVVIGGKLGDLEVTQTVSLKKAAKYFTVCTELKNTGTKKLYDVRYGRSTDPDNTVDMGGSYTTNNVIAKSFKAQDKMALVQGTDLKKISVLAYACTDKRCHGTHGCPFWTKRVYHSCIDNPPPKGKVIKGDRTLGMYFKAGDMDPGKKDGACIIIGLIPEPEVPKEVKKAVETVKAKGGGGEVKPSDPKYCPFPMVYKNGNCVVGLKNGAMPRGLNWNFKGGKKGTPASKTAGGSEGRQIKRLKVEDKSVAAKMKTAQLNITQAKKELGSLKSRLSQGNMKSTTAQAAVKDRKEVFKLEKLMAKLKPTNAPYKAHAAKIRELESKIARRGGVAVKAVALEKQVEKAEADKKRGENNQATAQRQIAKRSKGMTALAAISAAKAVMPKEKPKLNVDPHELYLQNMYGACKLVDKFAANGACSRKPQTGKEFCGCKIPYRSTKLQGIEGGGCSVEGPENTEGPAAFQAWVSTCAEFPAGGAISMPVSPPKLDKPKTCLQSKLSAVTTVGGESSSCSFKAHVLVTTCENTKGKREQIIWPKPVGGEIPQFVNAYCSCSTMLTIDFKGGVTSMKDTAVKTQLACAKDAAEFALHVRSVIATGVGAASPKGITTTGMEKLVAASAKWNELVRTIHMTCTPGGDLKALHKAQVQRALVKACAKQLTTANQYLQKHLSERNGPSELMESAASAPNVAVLLRECQSNLKVMQAKMKDCMSKRTAAAKGSPPAGAKKTKKTKKKGTTRKRAEPDLCAADGQGALLGLVKKFREMSSGEEA